MLLHANWKSFSSRISLDHDWFNLVELACPAWEESVREALVRAWLWMRQSNKPRTPGTTQTLDSSLAEVTCWVFIDCSHPASMGPRTGGSTLCPWSFSTPLSMFRIRLLERWIEQAPIWPTNSRYLKVHTMTTSSGRVMKVCFLSFWFWPFQRASEIQNTLGRGVKWVALKDNMLRLRTFVIGTPSKRGAQSRQASRYWG